MEEQYKNIFSDNRINSYSSVEQHDLNLELIKNLTKPLAVIEIVLRNRINKIMQKMKDEWILELSKTLNEKHKEKPLSGYKAIIYRKINEEIYKKDTPKIITNDQLISRMSFGFWTNMISFLLDLKHEKFDYKNILNVEKIDLLKYSSKNQNTQDNNLKLKIIIKLILKIRNRAFHWENLLKMGQINKKGKKLPNIFVKVEGHVNGIYPNKIEQFINDVLECFEENIINQYKSPLLGVNRH